MANSCMFYGIPCEAGTEGNCVCRKRFFASAPTQTRTKPMLIGDLQSWDLYANGEFTDHAEYVKWANAARNWSFGDSTTSGDKNV